MATDFTSLMNTVNTLGDKGLQMWNKSGSSWGSIAGGITSSIGSLIGNKYGEDFSEQQKSTQNMIRQGIGMIPGVGQAISAATGVIDAIGTMTGTNLSNIDKSSAKRLGVNGTARYNNIVNSLPGVSMFFGLTGGRTNQYSLSDEAQEMESGYAGSVGDLRAAQNLSNKRVSGSQFRKMNSVIDAQRQKDIMLQQLNETNTMRKQSNYAQDLSRQNLNRYAGQNYLGMTVGRNGMKLMSLQDARRIINNHKQAEKLQNGGEIPGVTTSLMPTGNLHKELHHIEDTNPELGEIVTRKGIPVVAINENGEMSQVAEIERDEFIMSKSLTDEIERLFKIGDEEAMIECGKLVANEIVENTNDVNNVINLEEVDDGKEK